MSRSPIFGEKQPGKWRGKYASSAMGFTKRQNEATLGTLVGTHQSSDSSVASSFVQLGVRIALPLRMAGAPYLCFTHNGRKPDMTMHFDSHAHSYLPLCRTLL